MARTKIKIGHHVLTLFAGIALGIALSRFIPELLDTNPQWWIVLAVLLVAPAVYHRIVRREPTS